MVLLLNRRTWNKTYNTYLVDSFPDHSESGDKGEQREENAQTASSRRRDPKTIERHRFLLRNVVLSNFSPLRC